MPLIKKIREIKKNQLLVIITDREYENKDKNISILKKPINSFNLAKILFEINKRIMERKDIRKDILENRLNLLINSNGGDFLFSLSTNYDYADNEETWSVLCKNTIKTNKEFENFFKSDFTKEEGIKFLSRKLNNYYQIFHFIKEIDLTSKFLLNFSIFLSEKKKI